MVPLPLFKLGALLFRQASKLGANRIKIQAHEHPRFRKIAAKYGQILHQINMRQSVAMLRDSAAERKAKEKAEAPTVKTKEQTIAEEAAKEKKAAKDKEKEAKGESVGHVSIWRRKFRPLPEEKAVDLFADFIGDAFILGVAMALVIYEYWRSSKKPDNNAIKIAELGEQLKEDERRIGELEAEKKVQAHRVEILEQTIEVLQHKQPKEQVMIES